VDRSHGKLSKYSFLFTFILYLSFALGTDNSKKREAIRKERRGLLSLSVLDAGGWKTEATRGKERN